MPAKSQLLFHIPTLPGRFPNPEPQTPANPPSTLPLIAFYILITLARDIALKEIQRSV